MNPNAGNRVNPFLGRRNLVATAGAANEVAK